MKKILGLLAAMTLFTSAARADDHIGDFRHVVLFKFNPEATEAQITEIEEAFRELPEKIDTIIDFEWGTSQTLEEGLDQGYTHCFLVTFADKSGLETYLPHPDHQAFVKMIRPLLAEVHVFDYEAGK